MRFANFFTGLAIAALFPVYALIAKAQPNPLNSLAQPGTEYSSQEFGTGPSMAVFNGKIYIAYQANDGSHNTMITTSSDGVSFSSPVRYSYLQTLSATGPALTVGGGFLWLAFTGEDGYVYLTASHDGYNFPGPTGYGGPAPVIDPAGGQQPSSSSPAIAFYNGLLWITNEDNGSGSNTRMYANTYNLATNTFSGANYCGTIGPDGEQPQAGAAIGLTVFNNLMYFAYQTQGNWNHELLVCSTNGVINNATTNVYPSLQVGSGISATAYDGALYLAYKVLSGNNNLTIAETTNGTTFSTNVYSNIKINGRQQLNPSTAVFGSYYYLTYASNDGDHHMYLTVN